MNISDIDHLRGEIRHWVMGTICGFPPCCIGDFIANYNTGAIWEPRKLTGTGYVPCPTCNMKSEVQLRKAIDSRRVSSVPFPNPPWEYK